MPLPDDFAEAIKQVLVAVLDTNPAIVALAGRASGTVIPYDDLGDPVIPGIEYLIVSIVQIGGIGDTRRALITFTASAEYETDANALLDAVEKNLTCPNMLLAGLDAYPQEINRTGIPGRASDGTSSANLDMTLIVTK